MATRCHDYGSIMDDSKYPASIRLFPVIFHCTPPGQRAGSSALKPDGRGLRQRYRLKIGLDRFLHADRLRGSNLGLDRRRGIGRG